MTLEVKNLNVAYGEREILNDISFKLTDGQIIGLIFTTMEPEKRVIQCYMRLIHSEIRTQHSSMTRSIHQVTRIF